MFQIVRGTVFPSVEPRALKINVLAQSLPSVYCTFSIRESLLLSPAFSLSVVNLEHSNPFPAHKEPLWWRPLKSLCCCYCGLPFLKNKSEESAEITSISEHVTCTDGLLGGSSCSEVPLQGPSPHLPPARALL